MFSCYVGKRIRVYLLLLRGFFAYSILFLFFKQMILLICYVCIFFEVLLQLFLLLQILLLSLREMIARRVVVIAVLRECSSISIFGVFAVLDSIFLLPTALEEKFICF